MLALDIQETTKNWQLLNNTLFVPHNESDYEYLVQLLDSLIDEVGENESHPLANLMEIIGVLIENYENEKVPEI
jgi:HTH-type transcriptional regulator/antitoxin HigA